MRWLRSPSGPVGWSSLARDIFLAIGLGLAVVAAVSPADPPDCTDPDSACSVFGPGERRARDRQLEMIGGKAMVMAVEFKDWAATWLRGRRLATLMAALSFIAAVGCEGLARLLRAEEGELRGARASPADEATRARRRANR